MLSDCHFQVMKCWCILKEMAFWSHISPEFTAFLKKCCYPVLSDKLEMRISTCKLNQFRGKWINLSTPWGITNKSDDAHLMNAIRKVYVNVGSYRINNWTFFISYIFISFFLYNTIYFFLNSCQCDMFLNKPRCGFACVSTAPRCFVSLFTPVNIKKYISLPHMSELLQPWIILAVSESRANASWWGAHFSGGRALSGIARYGRGEGIMCACTALPN